MKRTRKVPTRARLGVVALACVAVAGGATVLAHATVPGKNGKIVFRKALGNPARLAIVNADGTSYRMLPRAKGVNDGDPDWSHDGSTIVFERCPLRGGNCVIFSIHPTGSGLKRLGPAGDDRGHPAWAPSGKEIAYSRGWGGVQNGQIKFADIYVMKAGGTGARRITRVTAAKPFSANVVHPAWSPDGKQLVFSVETTPAGEPANSVALFVVNADGSGLRQLTPWSLDAGDRPDWSPDGKLILFRAPAKNNRGNLYTINPDGSGLKQLTHYPGNVVVTGSFSPDGEWITFAKSANVFVMRADGTGARRITQGVSAWSPDWGPAR
jgi:TolB protein